jgi:predicted nucleotidyltransferase
MVTIKEIISKIEREHKIDILYLSMFGSRLYGTDTPESDSDFRGVFLPRKDDLLLGKVFKNIRYSTGTDHTKNTKDDLDVVLLSLHRFIEFVGKGEIKAIDLLFSVSNKDCVLYYDKRMEEMFNNPLRFFDPRKNRASIGYCISQANKYGLKGDKLRVIGEVYHYLRSFLSIRSKEEVENGLKLSNIVDELINRFGNTNYLYVKKLGSLDSVVLCGRTHLTSISVLEFFGRVKTAYNKYGQRARQAERNEGVDWKAMSHAVRAIEQMKQLLTTGKITFPLEHYLLLLKIKEGLLPRTEVDSIINKGLEEIESIQKSNNTIKGKVDTEFINEFILSFYK